jgi:hypothetical protein
MGWLGRAARVGLLLGVIPAISGCPGRRMPEGGSLPKSGNSWSFSLDETFYTTAGGQSLAALPPWRVAWEGEIVTGLVERWPDDSRGLVVRFGDVRVAEEPAVQMGASATSSMAPEKAPPETNERTVSELSGRPIEVRNFDSGEILAFLHLDHVLGPPRSADLMLPLWASLSPVVPHLKSGKEGLRGAILPFMRDNRVGFRGGMHALWRNEGMSTLDDGTRARHFHYDGEPYGKAVDAGSGPTIREILDGTVSGDVFLERGSNRLLRHDFRWETTMTAWFGRAETGLAGRLDQKVIAVGKLVRRPGEVTVPRLRYLDESDVLGPLHGGQPLFNACFSEPSAPPVELDLAVNTRGQVTEAKVLPPGTGKAATDACLSEAARKVVFPEQDEPRLHVGYTVARVSGTVQPFPNAALALAPSEASSRHRPLFIFLPELDSQGWSALDAALGIPSP